MAPRPDAGVLRGVRAAVLTVPAVGGAALAHALVAGCATAAGTFLALGSVWPLAVWLLGRRRRVVELAAWLVAAQLVTHVLLDVTCRAVTSGHASAWHHLAAGLTGRAVVAHVVSLALTAVLLGRADAGLWTARALVAAARRLQLPVLRPVPVEVRPAPAPPEPDARPGPARHAPPPQRRGPPALAPA